jgi:hypothetical protein
MQKAKILKSDAVTLMGIAALVVVVVAFFRWLPPFFGS